jgi:uncharacterized membrane protein YdjX (TVP38/TMEM64 family)
MKRYVQIFFSIIALLLITFFVAEALKIPLLSEPEIVMGQRSLGTALIGGGLLVSDVLLPIPSSIIIMLNGKLFGAVVGTLISLVGTMGSSVLAFYIGRCGGPLLDRVMSPEEHARGNAMLKNWGPLAIIVTRPIPLLAESVSVMAGTSPMSWRSMLLASLAGNIPACAIYATTGASVDKVTDPLMLLVVVTGTGGIFFLAGKLLLKAGFAKNETQ